MEFEAIVLCGEGRKLSPITPGVPKALLPVANLPLVAYVLGWCKRARFAKITVAINDEDFDSVSTYIHSEWGSINVFRVPPRTKGGELLALLASKIERDFAILPCDLSTLSDLDPEQVISVHRAQDFETTLVTGFYYENKCESIDKKVLEPQVLLKSPEPSFLLDAYSRQSIRDIKQLKLRMAMLWKFPKVVATTEVLSSGIYFCRKAVLSVLDKDIDLQEKTLSKAVRDLGRRTWQHRQRREGVAMVTLVSEAPVVRVTNIPAYLEANRQVMRKRARAPRGGDQASNAATSAATSAASALSTAAAAGEKPTPAAPSKHAAVIGNDSLVGSDTVVGERSSLKRTCVGNNCEIGRKCRLTGCVILNGVKIEDDVVLENTVVGQGAVIESRSRLVGCEVEGTYHVSNGTEAKNEALKGLSMLSMEDEEMSLQDLVEEDSSMDDLSDEDDGDSGDASSSEPDPDDLEVGGDDFFDRS